MKHKTKYFVAVTLLVGILSLNLTSFLLSVASTTTRTVVISVTIILMVLSKIHVFRNSNEEKMDRKVKEIEKSVVETPEQLILVAHAMHTAFIMIPTGIVFHMMQTTFDLLYTLAFITLVLRILMFVYYVVHFVPSISQTSIELRNNLKMRSIVSLLVTNLFNLLDIATILLLCSAVLYL